MAASFRLGWRQVWLGLVLLSAGSMVTTTYGIISIQLMAEFKPSRMVLMLTLSVLSVVTAVLAPQAGSLMDRIALRKVILIGCVLLCSGFFALSFVTEFWQVFVVYGLLIAPAQISLGNLAITVLISRWFSAMRGRAMGIALTGVSIGGFVYPLMIQGLFDTFDWRTAMRIFAAIVACIVFPCALLVINRPSDAGLHSDGAEAEPEHADAEALAAKGMTSRAILSQPTFWMLAVILAVFFSGMRGLITNIAPMAADQGIDPTYIAMIVSGYSVAGIVAKLGYAWIADRADPRRLLYITMAGACAAHICLTMADQGLVAIASGAILMGLFGGMLLPMQSYLVPRIFGRAVVGRVSGLLALAMFVFNVSAPPLFGLIYDLTGTYDAVYASYAGLLVAVMFLVPRMRLDPPEVETRAQIA